MGRIWTWRSAVIAALSVVAGSLAVGQPITAAQANAAPAAAIERYNPYVSGNRVVFTQVRRAADGSSSAAVWARDLVSGAESLVANVGTGEPMPVTSEGWTAWSESPTDGRVAVRARRNNGGPLVDVFATDWTPNYSTHPDYTLPLALSGNELTTTNGEPINPTLPELTRFTLPNNRPTFVDVMSTAPYPTNAAIAQGGRTTVISEGNNVLFSVVDGAGRVVAAPSPAGPLCMSGFNPNPDSVAFDGTRVAVFATCPDPNRFGQSGNAVVTCSLPCRTVDVVNLPTLNSAYGFAVPHGLTLADGKLFFAVNTPYEPSTPGSQLYEVDARAGATPRMIWATSDDIGPRLSASGNRLLWDQTGYHDGVLRADLYQFDIATSSVSMLRADGTVAVPTPTSAVRHDPDISGNTIVYADRALDRSSAGIWTRSLTGSATMISSVATDASAPRTRDGWTAWNTRDAGFDVERVFATRGAGRPLVDVYSTNIANFTPSEFFDTLPVELDLAGNDRVVVSGWQDAETPPGCCFPPSFGSRVYERRLPNGPTQQVGSLTSPAANFVPQQGPGRGEGRVTVASVQENYFDGPVVRLYDGRNAERTLSMPRATNQVFGPNGCLPGPIDVSSTDVVVASNCFADNATWLASCDLPCANGLANAIPLPADSNPFDPTQTYPAQVDKLAASASKVVVLTSSSWAAGRYGTRFGARRSLTVYDLAHAQAPPVVIPLQTGVVSAPRIDGDRVVFSVVRGSGSFTTGDVYLFDVRTGALTTL